MITGDPTSSAASAGAPDRRRRSRALLAFWSTVIVVLLAVVVVLALSVLRSPEVRAGLPSFVGRTSTTSSVRTAENGYVPEHASLSAFDDDAPAIARLDPDLRRALRAAARDAERDGVTIEVTSGWRSAAFQQLLLDEAVQTYGSMEQARRFVSTPERSHHVSGDAVDVGPYEADLWLAEHGTDHGLCQVYANEAWHFERVTSPGGSCPELLADASS